MKTQIFYVYTMNFKLHTIVHGVEVLPYESNDYIISKIALHN